jgi:MFS family permease
VIACASAPVGGLLAEYLGWRVALMALAVFGAITLAMVAWRFKETLAHKNPRALEPLMLLRTWALIVRHPTFWAYTLLATTSYGGLFTFLAAGSRLNVWPVQAGLWVAVWRCRCRTSGTFIAAACCRSGVRRTVAIAASRSRPAPPWACSRWRRQSVRDHAAFYLFMLDTTCTSWPGGSVARSRKLGRPRPRRFPDDGGRLHGLARQSLAENQRRRQRRLVLERADHHCLTLVQPTEVKAPPCASPLNPPHDNE